MKKTIVEFNAITKKETLVEIELTNEQMIEYENQQKDFNIRKIRMDRDVKCFHVINRGNVWYNTLTQYQQDELQVWYQAWLDAPSTLEVPSDLEWL